MSRGVALGLSAYVVWGLLPLYWKQLQDVAAGDVITFRILATFVVLLALHAIRRTGRSVLSAARHRRSLGIAGITGALLAVNWLVYVWAVYDERILEASLGYFINPLINVVLGVLVLGERMRPVQWVAVAMASSGVLVLTIDVGTFPWVSFVLAATFGAYGLLRKTSPAGSLDGLTLEMGLLVPLALAVAVYTAGTGGGTVGLSVPGRDLLLLGTGVVTAVPLLLFASAARKIDLSLVGILQYVAPTLQFLIGVLVYHESWSGGQVVGYCIIWSGLIVFALDGLAAARRAAVLPASRSAKSAKSARDEVEGVVIDDLSG